MGVDRFHILSRDPGCLRIKLPQAAILYVPAGLFRLRQMPSVSAARMIMNGEAVEIEYDARFRSTEEFLTEIAQNLGLPLDAEFLASGMSRTTGISAEAVGESSAPIDEPSAVEILPPPRFAPVPEAGPTRSERGSKLRDADLADGWTVRSVIPGRIRLHHPMIAARTWFRNAIERRLTNMEGVNAFNISPITGTVLIEHAIGMLRSAEIIDRLQEAGRQATAENESAGAKSEVLVETTTLRLMMSTVAMLLSAGSLLVPALRPLATGVTALAGSHIVVGAARALVVERRLRVDVLDATVITVALAYQKVLAAGFMVWVVDLSEALLAASSQAQRRNLTELFGRQARRAWRLEDGVEFDRAVTELQIGDVIVVHAGEQIPVDGEIVSGEASIDRSALTGEHAAVECLPGERVFAMSVLLAGSLHVIVRQTGADTTAARMVQIVEESLEHKPKLQSLAERFAESMVTPTLGLGGVAYGIAGPGPMLAVINADFGTGIRVAGPLAMLASLSAAARNGILIKKGQVLEDLGRMNAVVFDKTGTLTEEVPRVERILVLTDEYDENHLLAFAAAAERRFSHPIARGIVNAAADRRLTIPETEDAGYEIGLGVRVRIGERPFALGSLRFISQSDVAVADEATAFADDVHRAGGTAIFIASEGLLLGVIELIAVAREEAAGLVRYLRETKGIEEIHLLSGDHDVPVGMLARQLGINHYQSAMLPQQKADYVREMQSRGLRVAMFGDGVNDTAGLAQANYSISLRGASDVATDVADVVFLDGNLAKFPLLDHISTNLSRNVKRSFALTLAPNSVCIAGAMMGFFGLGASLIFNNVGNLVTVINGSRAQSGLNPDRTAAAALTAA